MKPNSNPQRRRAFTVIEIVVVLFIMVVLAAVIASVYSRAKERKRRSKCQNNFEVISLAMAQYVMDSGDTFPGANFQPALYPYLKPPEFFECPTLAALVPRQGKAMERDHWMSGYTYNSFGLAGKRFNDRGQQLNDLVRTQSNTWLFTDEVLEDGLGSGYRAKSSCGHPAFWSTIHQGGANYAFVDGHTKWMTPETIDGLACGAKK